MGGITPAELAAIGDRLEGFADDLFASLQRADQRARGQCYLRGLLLEGRRKSIEPMAARLGEVHYQALHHFVAVSPWDWRPVRRRLAERLVAGLAPTAWVVDDTGFPKDGPCSVGVQRQYSGTLGKRANCQLGVPAGRVGQRRHRAGLLPAGLAAVCARALGRGCDGRPAGRLPPAPRHPPPAQVAAGVGHAG
jgi:SRSO17 transposase